MKKCRNKLKKYGNNFPLNTTSNIVYNILSTNSDNNIGVLYDIDDINMS